MYTSAPNKGNNLQPCGKVPLDGFTFAQVSIQLLQHL
jgi:hypothetical protein